MQNDNKNFWGIPYGTEVSAEALIHDLWDPTTEEIFIPKRFFGVGWGVNLYAVAKKSGVIK
jgi:hypothetical protein